MDTIEKLQACGFHRVGQIAITGDHPVPLADDDCSWVGGVYAWVAHSKDSAELLYIGKAGSTLRRRCRQHENGFNGKSKSKAGLRNGAYLAGRLSSGDTVTIWGRESERIELFGVRVSLHSTEEEALIRKFNPPLNRAAKSKEQRSA